MKIYSANTKVTGYHGTYSDNVNGILEKNFFESENHLHWFGDGVYFFIDGVSTESPLEVAKQYKTDEVLRDHANENRNVGISVLEAVIKLNNDRLLDLTQVDGSQLFNQFRTQVIDKISFVGKKPIEGYNDYDIFNLMRKNLGIEFVKANVYIKFSKQRKGNFRSNVPNVTIFTVNNPLKNISRYSIKEVYKGEVKV